ncbi:MAG: twin-arginine translocase TatA/TatE family subunit, partial [Actinomycetota bacterium]|nr:twin-arginine translocase TatA/TatE family subunit [Actinomycetota bacterium]
PSRRGTGPRLAFVGSIGPLEVLVVLVVALLVLGPEKLPGAARSLGRAIGEVRRYTTGFQNEMRDAFSDPEAPASESWPGQPSTIEPSTGEPSTIEPSTGEPSTGEPSTGEAMPAAEGATVTEAPAEHDNGDTPSS